MLLLDHTAMVSSLEVDNQNKLHRLYIISYYCIHVDVVAACHCYILIVMELC